MVKYGDISKDRLKPFDDDFESKVKLATKVKGANDKTSTTLKYGNGIAAKIQHKTNINLPVFDEVSLNQTMEFSQNDYTLTSEFSKASSNFKGQWKQEKEGVTSEYTLTQKSGAVTAVANTKIDAAGKTSWKVNAAYETKADDSTTVQVGGQVNDKYASELSLGVLSSAFGNLMFKTDLAKHSTASLFPLKFLDFGYDLSVGHSAAHTADVPLKEPALVLVANKGKAYSIKAKYSNFNTADAAPSVTFIMKQPITFTGTWALQPKKGHVFGVNMTL